MASASASESVLASASESVLASASASASASTSAYLDIKQILKDIDNILVPGIKQEWPYFARSDGHNVAHIFIKKLSIIDELDRNIETISGYESDKSESDNYIKSMLAKCLDLKFTYDNNIEKLNAIKNRLLQQMYDISINPSSVVVSSAVSSTVFGDPPIDGLLFIINFTIDENGDIFREYMPSFRLDEDMDNIEQIKINITNGYQLFHEVDIKNAISILSKMIKYAFYIYKNRNKYIHINTYEAFLDIFRYLIKYAFLFSSYEMTNLIIDISHYITNSRFTSENIIEILDILLLDREYMVKHLWECGAVFSFDEATMIDQYFYDKLLEYGEIDITTFNYRHYLSDNMLPFYHYPMQISHAQSISRYERLNHFKFHEQIKKLNKEENWKNRKALAIFNKGLAMFFNFE